MKRIYHPWELWEDHKCGFYDNCSGEIKKTMIKHVIEMFNSWELTILNMNKVVKEWPNSCEHNLTNESMNKIAYIGQAACCLYAKVPSSITMEAWSLLDKKIQERANKIAESVLETWVINQKHKQLCLKFD